MPLKLLPEEALLLLNKGLAELIWFPKLCTNPTSIDKRKYKELQDSLQKEQRKLYREIRKEQVEKMMDKIVRGKRKRGDLRDPEDILEDEVRKSCDVTEDNMLWPTMLQHGDSINGWLKICD